jgi:hypothetical protein
LARILVWFFAYLVGFYFVLRWPLSLTRLPLYEINRERTIELRESKLSTSFERCTSGRRSKLKHGTL